MVDYEMLLSNSVGTSCATIHKLNAATALSLGAFATLVFLREIQLKTRTGFYRAALVGWFYLPKPPE